MYLLLLLLAKLKELALGVLSGIAVALLFFGILVVVPFAVCYGFSWCLDRGEKVEDVSGGKCFAKLDGLAGNQRLVEIQTRIDGAHWIVDGVKSCHRFVVTLPDEPNGACDVETEEKSTGSTFGLKGIRNLFSAKPIPKGPGCVIKATGQTASPFCLLPNIDYRFVIDFAGRQGARVIGYHDGFPRYSVHVDGKPVYYRRHKLDDCEAVCADACNGQLGGCMKACRENCTDDFSGGGCPLYAMFEQVRLLGDDLEVRADSTRRPFQ